MKGLTTNEQERLGALLLRAVAPQE
jgi:hypothetical protein